jgi:hypothetical protein
VPLLYVSVWLIIYLQQPEEDELGDELSSDAADVHAALQSGLLSKDVAEVNSQSMAHIQYR